MAISEFWYYLFLGILVSEYASSTLYENSFIYISKADLSGVLEHSFLYDVTIYPVTDANFINENADMCYFAKGANAISKEVNQILICLILNDFSWNYVKPKFSVVTDNTNTPKTKLRK